MASLARASGARNRAKEDVLFCRKEPKDFCELLSLASQAAQTSEKSKVFPAYQPFDMGAAYTSAHPRGVSHGEQGKVFFSEEKKQKTFVISNVCAAWTARGSIK